jgi:predicted ribosomally synthesized six-cysteine peptide SCIFF
MKRIKLVATPIKRTETGCGECRSTCQSACKTSCTVGNQNCEKLEKGAKIHKAK